MHVTQQLEWYPLAFTAYEQFYLKPVKDHQVFQVPPPGCIAPLACTEHALECSTTRFLPVCLQFQNLLCVPFFQRANQCANQREMLSLDLLQPVSKVASLTPISATIIMVNRTVAGLQCRLK
jgi:hypothetical protein